MDQFDNLNKFAWKPIKLADKKSFEQSFKIDDENIKMQKYFGKSIGFCKEKPNIKIGIGILNRWLYVIKEYKEYIKYKKVFVEAKH